MTFNKSRFKGLSFESFPRIRKDISLCMAKIKMYWSTLCISYCAIMGYCQKINAMLHSMLSLISSFNGWLLVSQVWYSISLVVTNGQGFLIVVVNVHPSLELICWALSVAERKHKAHERIHHLRFTTLAYFQQQRTPKSSVHGRVPEVHKQRKLTLMVLDVQYSAARYSQVALL